MRMILEFLFHFRKNNQNNLFLKLFLTHSLTFSLGWSEINCFYAKLNPNFCFTAQSLNSGNLSPPHLVVLEIRLSPEAFLHGIFE